MIKCLKSDNHTTPRADSNTKINISAGHTYQFNASLESLDSIASVKFDEEIDQDAILRKFGLSSPQ